MAGFSSLSAPERLSLCAHLSTVHFQSKIHATILISHCSSGFDYCNLILHDPLSGQDQLTRKWASLSNLDHDLVSTTDRIGASTSTAEIISSMQNCTARSLPRKFDSNSKLRCSWWLRCSMSLLQMSGERLEMRG